MQILAGSQLIKRVDRRVILDQRNRHSFIYTFMTRISVKKNLIWGKTMPQLNPTICMTLVVLFCANIVQSGEAKFSVDTSDKFVPTYKQCLNVLKNGLQLPRSDAPAHYLHDGYWFVIVGSGGTLYCKNIGRLVEPVMPERTLEEKAKEAGSRCYKDWSMYNKLCPSGPTGDWKEDGYSGSCKNMESAIMQCVRDWESGL